MPNKRPTPARALHPNLASSADDLASQRTVRAEPPGNPAARIYQNLKSQYEAERNPEPQGSFLSQLLSPTTAPKPWKKKGK
jgi:hypothetical protein